MQEQLRKSLIQQLRESTTPLHKKLDDVFFKDMNHISLNEYENFLKRHHSFYHALHQNMNNEAQSFKAYLEELIGLIESDLLSIGKEILAAKSFELNNPLHPLGVAYVIYGSSNGAAMINAKIGKQEWASNLERSFLSRKEDNWKPFLKDINQYHLESQAIIASACQAFELVYEISNS